MGLIVRTVFSPYFPISYVSDASTTPVSLLTIDPPVISKVPPQQPELLPLLRLLGETCLSCDAWSRALDAVHGPRNLLTAVAIALTVGTALRRLLFTL